MSGDLAYQGALLEAHHREAFRTEHFDRWYQLWVESVDGRWSGPRAERAKAHAAATAALIPRRLRGATWSPAVGEARYEQR